MVYSVVDAQTLTVAVEDKKLVAKDFVIYNKPVWKLNLSLPVVWGCNVDLFLMSGFNKDLKGPEDEVDETGWCTGEYKGFGYEVGLSHFNLAPLGRINGDVVQPYVELSRRFSLNESHSITPYFRSEVLIPIGWKGGARTGTFTYVGARHEWSILERMSIIHRYAFVYDSGSFYSDRGWLGDYKIAFSWKINEHVLLDLPTFRVFSPISDLKDGRKTNTVFGSSITFKY